MSWDGDSALIPFLPGVAFDQYFPNLRMVQREGTMLYAKDAQQTQLAEFEDRALKAQQRFDRERAWPRFGTVALAAPAPGEQVVEHADHIVRINGKKARLWSETSYSSQEAHDALFSVIHQLLWDWVVTRDGNSGLGASMMIALSRQFDHYRAHGIPSDFLMRQIGRAPFAAWQGSQRPAVG